MSKCSINIGKLMKAFHKKVYYEWGKDSLYTCDEHGYVAMKTNDFCIFEDIKHQNGVELIEREGLKDLIETLLLKEIKSSKKFSYSVTGIKLPYREISEKACTLDVLRDREQKNSIKLLNSDFMGIFNPLAITGGKEISDPIIMICEYCYGLIMPVKPNKANIREKQEDIRDLLNYFDKMAN